MKHIAKLASIALVALSLVALTAPSWAGGNELRLRAELSAPAAAGDISGKAKFEDKGDRAKFSVEIEGLVPGDSFDVMVGGVVVGIIDVDAFGRGNLDFDTTAGPNDVDLPFPANFPEVGAGTLIQVGQLSGTLQEK